LRCSHARERDWIFGIAHRTALKSIRRQKYRSADRSLDEWRVQTVDPVLETEIRDWVRNGLNDTDQATARVPEKFLATQWLRVPGGRPTPAFEALCRRIASGEAIAAQPARKVPARPAGSRESAPAPIERSPEFPKEEPGQRTRFWFAVVGWLFKSAWALFKRWPRWVRLAVYVWLAIVLISRGCSTEVLSRERCRPSEDRSGSGFKNTRPRRRLSGGTGTQSCALLVRLFEANTSTHQRSRELPLPRLSSGAATA